MSQNDLSLARALTLYENSVPLTVGRATIAWNTLCGSIFGLYRTLSGLDDVSAKATFFAVASDRSQRDMVAALVKHELKEKHPTLARRANGLLAKTNGLAGRRNDVLHVILVDPFKPQDVHQMEDRGHLKGKRGNDLITAIHDFGMESLTVATEVMNLHSDLLSERAHQLVRRPMPAKIPPLSVEEEANPAEYGLLNALATKPQPNEESGD